MGRDEPVQTRRNYLATVGTTATAVGLSGCTGGGPQPPNESTNETAPASDERPIFPGYETTEVTVSTPNGERLGAVTAAIADTDELRQLGLSDTEFLPDDHGMLFIFDRVADRTFVMREMDFGIDIVYADASGTITQIHHAQAPGPGEDGEKQRYPGRGQYVLEVPLDWTTERDVESGARLDWGE
ncbi:hypothetical protein Halru_1251 [Halovivax ruber XH-70]|uniref:DUF192 domain-containing protein n=1 Tax=Halovivax ruber (strain DSM 18193 / JCM 13892 / XH-70) TaxID=797302 RepID=L0I8G7_HALRX|nr:DUF192 domain-containing protein [Halovivax ruber]AGB15865.1 hypothetical protein Halru_1251 [Halovivax ruber XH-70]